MDDPGNSQAWRRALRARAQAAERDNDAATLAELEVTLLQDEVKQLYGQLEHARNAYRDLFDNAPCGYVVLDPPHTVTDANSAACTLLGVQLEELLGVSLTRWFTAAQIAALATASPNGAEIRVGNGDGTDRILRFVGTPDPHLAGRVRIAAVDLTTWREAEGRIHDQHARLVSLLDTSNDAVISIDARGIIEVFNGSAERMFGYTAEEVIGEDVGVLMSALEGARHSEALARRHRKGSADKKSAIEVTARRKDGAEFPARVSIGEIRDGEIRYTAFIQDLTQQQRMHAELDRAAKVETIGQVAAGLAHDLRSLLTGIASVAAITRQQIPADAPAHTGLGHVDDAVGRGVDLVNQLLAVATGDGVTPRAVHVDQEITKLTTLLTRLLGAHVSLRLNLQAAGAVVVADPGQLDQILLNLTLNARDAMPHGGDLTVSTTLGANTVCIEVTDVGDGMDDEVRCHIFDPLFTTKGTGSGLGLASVHAIVVRLGGTIAVETEPGRGSAFRVTLPTRSEEVE